MKIILSLFIIIQILTLKVFAVESIQIVINENSLTCNNYLTVSAPNISHLVYGNYPSFKFRATSVENLCFYRQYIIDKASQNNGQLAAQVQVHKTNIKEPIYRCPPRPCPFCDPIDDCKIIGYKDYVEESVNIDILGLRFYGKSILTPN